MATPSTLKSATPEEKTSFRWLERQGHLRFEQDFLFLPLLLGGINLGFVRVNFYLRAAALGSPVGWRVRPPRRGQEKTRERYFIQAQENSSTAKIVRVDADDVLTRANATLRAALNGRELGVA